MQLEPSLFRAALGESSVNGYSFRMKEAGQGRLESGRKKALRVRGCFLGHIGVGGLALHCLVQCRSFISPSWCLHRDLTFPISQPSRSGHVLLGHLPKRPCRSTPSQPLTTHRPSGPASGLSLDATFRGPEIIPPNPKTRVADAALNSRLMHSLHIPARKPGCSL